MTTYLLPKARNSVTGETVKTQDLTGARYTLKQRSFAEQATEQLAQKMTVRTETLWTPIVVEYRDGVNVAQDVPR